MLAKRGIPHNVLNAKFHEQEAHIIAQAGRLGQVTIATNMAGRGTDIILGGNPEVLAEDVLRGRGVETRAEATESRARLCARGSQARSASAEHVEVVEAGGLAVLGTERHESRRIDNQLRGRSGRQGDPGALAVLPLAGGRPACACSAATAWTASPRMMQRTEIPDDMPIQAGLVTKAIESAQRRSRR